MRTPWGTSLHGRAQLLEEVVTVIFLGLVVGLFIVRRRQTRPIGFTP